MEPYEHLKQVLDMTSKALEASCGHTTKLNRQYLQTHQDLIEALQVAYEALENYEDVVDGEDGEPMPNRAMKARIVVGEALRKAGVEV